MYTTTFLLHGSSYILLQFRKILASHILLHILASQAYHLYIYEVCELYLDGYMFMHVYSFTFNHVWPHIVIISCYREAIDKVCQHGFTVTSTLILYIYYKLLNIV